MRTDSVEAIVCMAATTIGLTLWWWLASVGAP